MGFPKAWEEQNEDCRVKATLTCETVVTDSSDTLCECAPPGGAPAAGAGSQKGT